MWGKNRLVAAIGGMLCAATITGAASAAVITDTQTFFMSLTAYAPNNFLISSTMNFAEFDPSLGTLNSIGVEMESLHSNEINLDGEGSPVTASLSYIMLLAIADDDPFNFSVLGSPSISCSSDCPQTHSGGGLFNATVTFFPVSLTFDDFIGLGTVPVKSELSLTYLNSGLGDANFHWDGDVTVTYDYTPFAPVPAPAGLALLGIGLAGAGLARRRHRA